MNKPKKGPIVFFGGIILFILSIYIWGRVNVYRINKDGVYVIGIIEEINSTKSDRIHICKFLLGHKTYSTKFSAVGLNIKVGDLVFVKVSRSHPDASKVLYEQTVPKCLDLDKSPSGGWNELPLDSCK